MDIKLFVDFCPALLIILVAARGCGRVAIACGQPRVVGEMVAGIVLGPSLLGGAFPDWHGQFFSREIRSILFVLSNIGLSLYMFLVGTEVHGLSSRKDYGKAGVLAVSGIVPPMILGGVVAICFYTRLSLPTVSLMTFCLFMGAALSITAFPMLARILRDENLTRTPLGSLTLLAASIDDGVAWCLLALLTALARAEGPVAGLFTGFAAILFACAVLFIVKPILARYLRRPVDHDGGLSQGNFALIIGLVLVAAWITDMIGVYSVFGGFFLGLAMPRDTHLAEQLNTKLHDFVVVFFLPLFFTYSGLNTKLSVFMEPSLLLPFAAIMVAALGGKLGGCTLAMRGLKCSWSESLAVGSLMNARGLMELILINIGLQYKLIHEDLFSLLVGMAIITTALALPLFRWSGGVNRSVGQRSQAPDAVKVPVR